MNDFEIQRIADGYMTIRVPRVIARIKLCGALTFEINDTMQFEMPTKEQCENLKKTFGIEVELIDEGQEVKIYENY